MTEKFEVKIVRVAHTILWLGLIAAFVIFAGAAGWPGGVAFVGTVLLAFAGLWTAGEAEGKVIDKHRGVR